MTKQYSSIEIRKLDKGYLISKNEPVSSLPLPVAAVSTFEQVVATLREYFGEVTPGIRLAASDDPGAYKAIGDLGGKYMKPRVDAGAGGSAYERNIGIYKAVADEIYKAAPQAKPALKFPSEKEDFDDCA